MAKEKIIVDTNDEALAMVEKPNYESEIIRVIKGNYSPRAALEKLEKAAEGRFSPLNYCTKDMVSAEIARLKGDA